MKKLSIVLLAALMIFGMVACGSKGSSNGASGGGSDVKGEVKTGGNITVLVPESMDLTQGDVLDKDNQDSVTITDKSNSFKYILVSIRDEQSVDDGMAMTKEINSDCTFKDLKLELSNATFEGFSYDSYGTNCIQLKGKIGDKFVQISTSTFADDDSTLSAVLESITLK